MLPGKTFHGHASFRWLESGAFLLFHSHIDEPDIPTGLQSSAPTIQTLTPGVMLYFDVRNVSREYRWTISGNVWTWSRDDPVFSQMMVLTIASDRQSIEAKGQILRNGQHWEPDLQLTYCLVG